MPGLFGEAGWISYLFFVFPKEIDYKKIKEKLTTKQEMQEEESEATTSEQLTNLFRILPHSPTYLKFKLVSKPIIDLSHGLFSPLYSASQEMEEEEKSKSSFHAHKYQTKT